jgi:hypothetical protein
MYQALTLPSHKANSPMLGAEYSAPMDGARRGSLTPTLNLHSPISPLSSESPLYPDGIMTNFWFSKHRTLLPSAMLAFFKFSLDPNNSTLQDNKLKTEINAVRTSINASGYKFRLVVVLIAENGEMDANATERLSNIRKATSLDAKLLFLLRPDQNSVEIRAFVGTI